jgi:hypothetical protein
MDRSDIRLPPIDMPLTRFIRQLYKKTPAERQLADPQKAADGYKLPLATTTWWIEEARRCPDVWPMKTRRK